MRHETQRYEGHDRFIPYLLNRVVLKLNAGFQRELEARGMTLTHWRVLAFLSRSEGLPITALAEATVTKTSTLSRALVAMARRQWISRHPVKADNRAVVIRIGEKGRVLFDELLSIALQLECRALAGLSSTAIDAMRRSLGRIEANLDRRPSRAAAKSADVSRRQSSAKHKRSTR